MSTVRTPPAPPAAQTAYQDSGGAGHQVQVTRNVPPKRVMVNSDNVVVHDDKTYTEGESVALPGPVADQLAFNGHVVVVDHDASDDVDEYQHADGKNAIPVDVTGHRQQLGQKHMLEGRTMTDKEGGAS